MAVTKHGDSSEQGIVNVIACAQKECLSTESTCGIGDGLADKTDNVECMEGIEKGHKHIGKCSS